MTNPLAPPRPDPTWTTDGPTRSTTDVTAAENASRTSAPVSITALVQRAAGADLRDLRHRFAELLEPVALVLLDEPDAPRDRLTAAAGDARVHERVEDHALLLAEPGHDRDRHAREEERLVAVLHAPQDRPLQPAFGLVRDRPALLAGGLAVLLDSARGRCLLGIVVALDLRLLQRPDPEHLLAIDGPLGCALEPVLRDPPRHPALNLIGFAHRHAPY